jgi:hypothetical protein
VQVRWGPRLQGLASETDIQHKTFWNLRVLGVCKRQWKRVSRAECDAGHTTKDLRAVRNGHARGGFRASERKASRLSETLSDQQQHTRDACMSSLVCLSMYVVKRNGEWNKCLTLCMGLEVWEFLSPETCTGRQKHAGQRHVPNVGMSADHAADLRECDGTTRAQHWACKTRCQQKRNSKHRRSERV